MSKLHRRLKKLEALITDEAGLVSGSQKWMDYWTERVDKILAGDDEVKGCQIPLEVWDAIMQRADSERSDGCR
jgi:hypothetical protein